VPYDTTLPPGIQKKELTIPWGAAERLDPVLKNLHYYQQIVAVPCSGQAMTGWRRREVTA
jgi:hypothetical protein